jgi:hypothetical protein
MKGLCRSTVFRVAVACISALYLIRLQRAWHVFNSQGTPPYNFHPALSEPATPWDHDGCDAVAYLEAYPDLRSAFGLPSPFSRLDVSSDVTAKAKKHYESWGAAEWRQCNMTEAQLAALAPSAPAASVITLRTGNAPPSGSPRLMTHIRTQATENHRQDEPATATLWGHDGCDAVAYIPGGVPGSQECFWAPFSFF